MDVSHLIITGVTTDMCILFTANDAYMRGFHIHVPLDCTAAIENESHTRAVELIRRVTDANIDSAAEIDLAHFETEKSSVARY
jgi:nicotinamidase-related amidase